MGHQGTMHEQRNSSQLQQRKGTGKTFQFRGKYQCLKQAEVNEN